MIARIIIPILLALLLSDAYLHFYLVRHKLRKRRLWLALLWLQFVLTATFSIVLASCRGFAPEQTAWLDAYLLLLGVWILPKFVFAVCSALGWGHCAYHKTRTNWGNPAGLCLAILLAAVTVYGSTWGFSELRVRHIAYSSPDLPEAFDGYRIVQFSDVHVGTYGTSRLHILNSAIDSILSAAPDLVVFTGDLQNMLPQEIRKAMPVLCRVRARDGVFSVLGNHDYATYAKVDDSTAREYEREIRDLQSQMGWRLLLNANEKLRRGNDSIVLAGMENDGRPPFPQRGDVEKTMRGVGDGAFTVMLEHDPTAWRRKILPQTSAQLTLSGHTHAAQLMLFGWSPSALVYKEWGGMYYDDARALNVSTGVGGFVPFRLGCPGEVVVITLKRLKNQL